MASGCADDIMWMDGPKLMAFVQLPTTIAKLMHVCIFICILTSRSSLPCGIPKYWCWRSPGLGLSFLYVQDAEVALWVCAVVYYVYVRTAACI